MKNILCFGDSNTWGYNPHTRGSRFPEGVRWTSRLQEKLSNNDIHIIEQGLCGRTTVFEDRTRPNLKGISALRDIFDESIDIDSVILMLGTNDCKTYYGNTPDDIAKGIEECLDIVLKHVSPDNVLLVSPIALGEQVWRDEFDPEFNSNSVQVSKGLKAAYERLAREKSVHFLAASEYAGPSDSDQEHLDEQGHSKLANAIFENLVVA
ncbi:MAG: GDSL-type esterase/lipase family protein [Lachnospiraceae bacterium]|nr:GDSL-type esterase/lipase family protein [Lachnospiraceae bacterium]